ncbi:MAG: hypothetical protein ISS78_09770 [Phycisphaerae bacterium]|nr:hypothetical protein [Phycisphaerae bacterium]
MKTLTRVTMLLGVCCCVPGCPPSGLDVMPEPVAVVAAIEMQVKPVAVDWDDSPGVDGLEIQVRLYRKDPVRAVPVSGKLEFMLYAGRIKADKIAAAKPLRTWSFSGEPLQRRAGRDLAGWHYVLRLSWLQDVPTCASATLIARYELPDGKWLYSSPNSSISIPQP